jgi:hypothetical protein
MITFLGAALGFSAMAQTPAASPAASPAPSNSQATSNPAKNSQPNKSPSAMAGVMFLGISSPDMALTPGQHFQRFEASVLAPGTFALPLVSAVWSMEVTSHHGYPNGWRGYQDVYRTRFEDKLDGKFLTDFAFPTVFHQDERYEPLGPGSPIGSRITHALMHQLHTRSDDHTHMEFNFEALPATMTATIISTAWQPASQRTTGVVIERFGLGVLYNVVANMATEFSPELMHLHW